MFQRPPPKPTAGDPSDRVGHAAVNLHINDQTLAMGWFIYAKESAAQHRHPHAQDLAWTEATAMHGNRIRKQFFKRMHGYPPTVAHTNLGMTPSLPSGYVSKN
jgi:hypothetical protein